MKSISLSVEILIGFASSSDKLKVLLCSAYVISNSVTQ